MAAWTLAKARQAVLERSCGRCERCGRALYPGWSCHHRRPRGMGGTKRIDAHSPANLAALCGSATTGCHGEVESDRTAALKAGWLVRLNADPAAVPVRVHGLPFPVLLTDDGCYASAAEPTRR